MPLRSCALQHTRHQCPITLLYRHGNLHRLAGCSRRGARLQVHARALRLIARDCTQSRMYWLAQSRNGMRGYSKSYPDFRLAIGDSISRSCCETISLAQGAIKRVDGILHKLHLSELVALLDDEVGACLCACLRTPWRQECSIIRGLHVANQLPVGL